MAIITEAIQLPITFSEVLPISISSSIPKTAERIIKGSPNWSAVAVRIISAALGIAATPLLVIIKVRHISSCCPIGISIPAACATKTAVRERYNAVPSRLKLYPVGTTKETILLGTPKASIFVITFGRAASELVVAKAIETGSLIAEIKFLIGIFKYKAKGSNTISINPASAA